ncbi:hypothetical protein B0H66DRAFT_348312 [Apodospora peruviana]|uniref:Uncharacterized protein n=1 Tax=Apodospora peruviana TaxID=516989 RepID=A0AAE0M046_9PEZI|nr:hypothetical protein B0H66DRAFT_348312 [Apodospora peruviana]
MDHPSRLDIRTNENRVQTVEQSPDSPPTTSTNTSVAAAPSDHGAQVTRRAPAGHQEIAQRQKYGPGSTGQVVFQTDSSNDRGGAPAVRLDMDLDLDVQLKGKIQGDVTLAILTNYGVTVTVTTSREHPPHTFTANVSILSGAVSIEYFSVFAHFSNLLSLACATLHVKSVAGNVSRDGITRLDRPTQPTPQLTVTPHALCSYWH